MIPLRAERRPAGVAWLSWTIGAACVGVLVRLAFMPAERAEQIVFALAVVPARLLASPPDPVQAVTLFTSAFLHAGWIHLGGNLLYLFVFGPTVELLIGRARFLGLYVAAGAAGALVHALVHPDSQVPLVGASAAIAGVLGAHLVLEPRSKIRTAVPVFLYFEIALLPAAFVISLWFALQVVLALVPSAKDGAESVAWFAHIGGFVTGMLVAAVVTTRAQRKRTSRGSGRRSVSQRR